MKQKAGSDPLMAARQKRGAEAVVSFDKGSAEKSRFSKRYRNPSLDRKLITERTRAEARLISSARRAGVPTPVIRDVTQDTLVMELIEGTVLTGSLSAAHMNEAGRVIGKLHDAGIVHGDLTTSNMILKNGRCVLIDFGLSQVTSEIEQRGVDIHVLIQTLRSTTPDSDMLIAAFSEGYSQAFPGAQDVLAREREIELRGRYL
jgi:N6-L-threonylcarbamoyladenine synthase/protein kinase Bud32